MKSLRRRIAMVAYVLAVTGASAQQQIVEIMTRAERPAGAPQTIGDYAKRLQQVRASVIAVDWSTNSFVIPVAGNTSGSGGTYFRSDVMFNNDRLANQSIAIGWLAQGQNNCSAPFEYFTLGPNSITVSDDFVGRTLNRTGLGAVLVLAVTATGELDDDGEIDATSRIWTPQPSSTGTVSQNFPAISTTDSLGSLPATLMGLKQSDRFRTNVGVVNLDDSPHNWTFTSIFNGRVTNVSVPGCSMMLLSAAANSSSSTGNLAFTVRSDGFGHWWSAFGSSTDNVTGDGWVSRAIQ